MLNVDQAKPAVPQPPAGDGVGPGLAAAESRDGVQRRLVTNLVWLLIAIGLLAGVLSNSLIGWTLWSLNRERVQLLEEDRHLGQVAVRLQRLGQEARGELELLLYGVEVDQEPSPVTSFVEAVRELRYGLEDYPGVAALNDLELAVGELLILRNRALAWLQSYQVVAEDRRQKITLSKVRLLLEEMRAAAETLEGRQRLAEALALRAWRQAETRHSPSLAQTFLEQHRDRRSQVVHELRGELAELSRLVEILAGEVQVDHLADLRDNQLQQVLERLERQVLWLADDGGVMEGLALRQIGELRELLFGRGHTLLPEYQTIRLGEGGLFRLSDDAVRLQREREQLQERAGELLVRAEAVYPLLADLAEARSVTITRQAQNLLSRGLINLLLLSFLVMVGFLALGWLISRRVAGQVRTMTGLRRQNELILNSAGEGILGLDNQGQVTFINPAGARLLKGPAADFSGRCFNSLLQQAPDADHGCQPPPVILNLVLGQGLSAQVDDHLFQCLDGTTFSGEYTANPIHNQQGEIEGAVITFLDISERKRAAAALQQTCAELDELNRSLEVKVAERTRDLEQKNQELLRTQEELVQKEKLAAVGSLAAGVAHEINNPAAIIRGNVEILRRCLAKAATVGAGPAAGPVAEPAAGEEEIKEILRNTERISRITQGLLLYARQQNRPPDEVAAEEVEVNQLLTGILDQVAHQVPLGEITIRRRFAPDLPTLPADQEKLRQVFTNLIVNAVQAMDGRGRLTVTSEVAAAGRELLVRVADSGPGIAENQRQLIFDPFYTNRQGGSGLGLAISYGIVRGLGGRIEVGGRPGEGAEFTVRLPLPRGWEPQVAGGR